MTTSEQYWLYQQLEPGDVIITGSSKREPTALQDKWRLDRADRERMGEAAYRAACEEFKKWEEDRYKD